MIFNCLKVRDRGEDKPKVEPKQPELENGREALNILFIPGHGPYSGANTYIPYLNESEWNREVVNGLKKVYSGKHNLMDCVYRYKGEKYSVYSKRIAKFCKDNAVDLVIEQHLNAAGVPEARGCEMLIPSGHGESAYYATPLAMLFSTRFNMVLRGNYNNVQGIKPIKKGQRGGGLLHEIVKQSKGATSAIIMEPFFCDYQTRESEQFLSKPDHGVEMMIGFYRKYLLTI